MIKNKFKTASLSALTFSFLLQGCDTSKVETDKSEIVRPVEVYSVQAASNIQSWLLPATVAAFNSTDMAFNSGGKVTTFSITKGQQVKKGQLLAAIDSRDHQLKLDSSKASFDQAQLSFNRAKKLIEDNVISKSDFDDLQSKLTIAQSQLQASEKALKDTKLYAPYDGAVASTSIQLHDTVSAGQSVISLIVSNKYTAKFDLSADKINYINNNRPEATYVLFGSEGHIKVPSDFKEISLVPSQSSQSYEVSLWFSPPENQVVLPGMSVQVQIDNKKSSENLSQLIPVKSVISNGEETFVWKLNTANMTAIKQPIKISKGIGKLIAVTEGIEAGDQIITSGAAYAVEGMKVTIWQKTGSQQ